MRHLKVNTKWKFLFGIIAFIAILGIVGVCLPDNIWIKIAGRDGDVIKYLFFICAEVFSILILINTSLITRKQKKIITELNALRDKVGESAYFVDGYCQMNEHDKDTINATVSSLGQTVASVLFGNAIYGVITGRKRHLFIFSDNGIFVIDSQYSKRSNVIFGIIFGVIFTKTTAIHNKIMFPKGKFKDVTIEENNKGQIELTCPNENLMFTFKTKNSTDITKEESKQHLQSLFNN